MLNFDILRFNKYSKNKIRLIIGIIILFIISITYILNLKINKYMKLEYIDEGKTLLVISSENIESYKEFYIGEEKYTLKIMDVKEIVVNNQRYYQIKIEKNTKIKEIKHKTIKLLIGRNKIVNILLNKIRR